jgi:hypothetical protein
MFEPVHCQKLVNVLIELGLTARYVIPKTYKAALSELDTNTVLVYVQDDGEDVILIADNLIDLVRFKFRKDGEGPIRVQHTS